MNEPLDELLKRLCDGDTAAAERVFVEYEPYLRKAIRRQLPALLRPKLDSADILQSVWVALLRGFRESGWRFANADQLRGFLFVATRNRVIDRVRRHRKTVAREEPLGEFDQRHPLTSPQPRPSEIAQADDVWERLLACCPPEHHRMLSLRRQGHSLAEIAARTGLHPDSIRRILRTLARQLAFGQPTPRRVPGGGPS
jgi:RNA polymerase sigma-70 factor (ECF subfamily)